MSISVISEMIVPASGKEENETRHHIYLDSHSLKRREYRAFETQSDTSDYKEYRDSPDNGKTWGEWTREKPFTKEKVGNDEISESSYLLDINVYNPIHNHYVTLIFQEIYLNGYEAATENYWDGKKGPIPHSYIDITVDDGKKLLRQPVKYEEGPDFSPDNYHTSGYLTRNEGLATGITILKNGDILFGLWTPVNVCCQMAGLDLKQVFPSAYEQPNGLLVCRGTWDDCEEKYNLSFSHPIIMDDRQSSRGISEPVFAELDSGKILLVLRASNRIYESWNPRISPYAPNFKYYSLSDDGGKTFAPPMPWHYDTREVIYSSATYSLLVRSEKNGKLYWLGNITPPEKTYGNSPRYPLYIVEVDDTWGCAKKDTLTLIDTRHTDESENVQLSNFGIIQNRETGDLELYLTKYEQFPGRHIRDCEVWKYTISL